MRVEADGQRARAVAQVPDGDGARRVDGGGEAGQVVEPARAVVDVVEQDRAAVRGPSAAGTSDGSTGTTRWPVIRAAEAAM